MVEVALSGYQPGRAALLCGLATQPALHFVGVIKELSLCLVRRRSLAQLSPLHQGSNGHPESFRRFFCREHSFHETTFYGY